MWTCPRCTLFGVGPAPIRCANCGARLDGSAEPRPPADDPLQLMGEINDALAESRRSYRSAISSMGAHGAPATAVVAFVLEWRLRQVPPAPPGAVGNVFAPTFPELADMIVAALRETGHVRD